MVDHFTSNRPGDLGERAAQAVAEDWTHLVAIGGDGSLHEVVNGLLSVTSHPEDRPVLGHLPAGSGNDWSTQWRIPRSPGRWLRAANTFREVRQGLGYIQYRRDGQPAERWFLNVAGLAYDAWVVRQVEANPGSKGHLLIYLLSVLKWLGAYRPEAATVRIPDRHWTGRFYTINAGICRYSGGGMRIVPQADPGAEEMAITVAGPLPLWRILTQIWRFYTGSIGRVKGVDAVHGSSLQVTHHRDQPLEIEADGEWLGHTPVKITYHPRSLSIWVP